MSRWIDAEYCEDFFDRWESRVKNAEPVTIDVVRNTRTLLREAPSIDIVRCRECRYFIDNLTENDTDETYDACRWDWKKCIPKADDFCSYGERSSE